MPLPFPIEIKISFVGEDQTIIDIIEVYGFREITKKIKSRDVRIWSRITTKGVAHVCRRTGYKLNDVWWDVSCYSREGSLSDMPALDLGLVNEVMSILFEKKIVDFRVRAEEVKAK